MTIEINVRHTLLFVFFSGALSAMAMVFGWNYSGAKESPTLSDMLGCLPGTQPTLMAENIGERRESVVAKCIETPRR